MNEVTEIKNNETAIIPAKKNKGGRPRGSNRKIEFSEEEYRIIENCFSMNMSIQDLSKVLGISEKTIDKYLKKDSRIANSFKNSRLKALTHVYSRLWNLIEEGDKTAIFFWLRNLGRDYFFENKSNQHNIALNNNPDINTNPTLLMNNFKQNILGITVNNNSEKVTNDKNMINDKTREVKLNDNSTVQVSRNNS